MIVNCFRKGGSSDNSEKWLNLRYIGKVDSIVFVNGFGVERGKIEMYYDF